MNRELPAVLSAQFYRYHCLTKHTLEKLYSGDHKLDWANQPDPFRVYEGISKVDLPEDVVAPDMNLGGLLSAMDVPGSAESPQAGTCDLSLRFLSSLLYFSMSISAWKQIRGTDHRWALRVNPSSGNLHPTETHLLIRQGGDIESGAYHYLVKEHKLEQRSTHPVAELVWDVLGFEQPCPPLLLCFSSIFWREAWKYRQRAYRYCNHDLGHALASVRIAAAMFGWTTYVVGEFADEQLKSALGLAGSDEQPLAVLALRPASDADSVFAFRSDLTTAMSTLPFAGVPNHLSPVVITYPEIENVHAATLLTQEDITSRRELLSELSDQVSPPPVPADAVGEKLEDSLADLGSAPAVKVVRRRRSAVDMDGRQRTSLARLSRMLRRSTLGFLSDFLANGGNRFFIHLYVYVHRVDGLEPGLYYYDRSADSLVLAKEGNHQKVAKFVSCLQDIAADGCFAVSMVADLNLAFKLFGERAYRYVHHEAGYIGQLLYLTSHALGLEATGIGCFMDDEINHYLNLPPGYEVIYNFTIGRAVQDDRLTDLPSYGFSDPTSAL